MNGVMAYPTLVDVANDLRNGLLSPCLLHLYKNDVSPTPDMTILAFTEADFSGYAPVTITLFNEPFATADGGATIVSPLVQFNMSAATTPNIIYGTYLTDITSTILIASAQFDAEKPMNGTSDSIPAVAEVHVAPPP
jgi:hypothetical protein